VDTAFDEGRILRTHVLRPTWHYVARDDLRWLMALSGPVVDAGNARRYRELELDARTRARATDVIVEAVTEGPLTRQELVEVLRRGGIAADGQRMPHLLMHAELHAAICSGPLRGRQQTYVAFDERVPPAMGPTGDDALAELARRYVTTRGPVTARDFGWWSGLRAADVHRALAAVDSLESAVVDGRTYWFGERRRPLRGTKVDLVQCYDEVIISYTESRDVLAGPDVSFPVPLHVDGYTHVVLLDGRLLGHWRVVRQRGAEVVETRLARAVTDEEAAAVEKATTHYLDFGELA
jgi:hypothetical protein